jgi:outer membrane protein assembly factor BamB
LELEEWDEKPDLLNLSKFPFGARDEGEYRGNQNKNRKTMKPTINKTTATQIVHGVMWSSGIFAVIMGILLSATLIQTRLHDPIHSQALQTLIERVEKDPSNESLKEEIRAFDLLARKAYFTSVDQIRLGTLIFIAAVATFLLCWKLKETMSPTLPGVPVESKSWWMQQSRSRKAVAAGGIFLFIMMILVGVLTKNSITSGAGAGSIKQTTDAEAEKNWCNFRGPEGIGIAHFTNAPTSWDGEKMSGIKWKTAIDLPGNSSPVVWENQIFVTGGSKDRREVYCFNTSNGKLIWRYTVKVAADTAWTIPKVSKETGFAAPTAVCDGQRVYAIFATGELIALTLNGKPVWSRHLGVPDNHYGHSSSLITRNGLLFVQFDQSEAGKLIAINCSTGKTAWEAKRTLLSWASPICVNSGKRYELILVDNEKVTSYNPSTGALLWSQSCLYGEVGPSAAYSNGKVFAANVNAVAVGFDINKSDSLGVPLKIWEYEGELPNSPSLVAIDSLLFFPSDEGTVTCLNASSGTEYWVEGFDNGFYASPIISGKNIYFLDRKGVMHIIEASSTYKEVGSPSLGEPAVCTPAILDGFMIIRGEQHLFRIDGVK